MKKLTLILLAGLTLGSSTFAAESQVTPEKKSEGITWKDAALWSGVATAIAIGAAIVHRNCIPNHSKVIEKRWDAACGSLGALFLGTLIYGAAKTRAAKKQQQAKNETQKVTV